MQNKSVNDNQAHELHAERKWTAKKDLIPFDSWSMPGTKRALSRCDRLSIISVERNLLERALKGSKSLNQEFPM